jgi:hypothetical protein
MWVRAIAASAVLLTAIVWSNVGWTRDFLSKLEEGVAREINLARTDPGQYASFLEEWSQYYNDKEIERAGQPTIITQEGVSAVKEAIRYLRVASSLPLLKISIQRTRSSREIGTQGVD